MCSLHACDSRTACRYMHEATRGLPIIGDADTGYGNAVNVKRTLRGFAAAGFAGILIEDQARGSHGSPAAPWLRAPSSPLHVGLHAHWDGAAYSLTLTLVQPDVFDTCRCKRSEALHSMGV